MTSTASKASVPWQIAHLESPVDGIKIRYGTFGIDPSGREADWGVLLLNGRSEWIEKYSDLPHEFGLGSRVMWASLDHRGQGASEGARAHVETYEDFARDAAAVAEAAFGDAPFVVLSHSMGGLIALTAVMRGLIHPRAMVLCSPLLALPNAPLHRTLAKPLARLMVRTLWSQQATGFKSKRESRFSRNALTHSYRGFQKILESPYPYMPPSFGWVAATFAACEQIFAPAALQRLRCPVKIIAGTEESVVDPGAFGPWCKRAQENSCLAEWQQIPQGRHELLNEIPRLRRQTIEEARAWLLKYGPPFSR